MRQAPQELQQVSNLGYHPLCRHVRALGSKSEPGKRLQQVAF